MEVALFADDRVIVHVIHGLWKSGRLEINLKTYVWSLILVARLAVPTGEARASYYILRVWLVSLVV